MVVFIISKSYVLVNASVYLGGNNEVQGFNSIL